MVLEQRGKGDEMTTVVIQFAGESLAISGNYTPEVPGRYTMPNGDPGYPYEPAEFEIEGVYVVDPATKLVGTGNLKDVFEGLLLKRSGMMILDVFELLAIEKMKEAGE